MFYIEPYSQRGACVDIPEEQKRWFFDSTGNTYKKAKKICLTCPIKTECLERALECEGATNVERYGVFGGMAADERRRKFGRPDEAVGF